MRKEEYVNVMEQITPKEEVKKEVWNRICQSTGKEKKVSTFRKWGLAAAVLAVVCVAGAFAPSAVAEIRSLILRETPSYGQLADSVETAVFSMEDEHICVTVEEMLSDGVVVEMTVKYTALDKTGKKWLEKMDAGIAQGEYKLNIKPHMINTIEYGVNYSYGAVELEEQATETERVFLLGFQASGRTYTENQGVFTFPMTETTESVILDVSGNVEIRTFALEGTEAASEYYTPTCIELSPMSFVIYAQNHGVFERSQNGDYYEEEWLLPEEEIDALEANSYFVMKDGSRMSLPQGAAHNTTHATPENMNSDVMLYSDRFYSEPKEYRPSPEVVNPDEFEAIVINGVRFEFVE